MPGKPLRMHVERRREHQNMRVFRPLQMRQAGFRREKRSARIDAEHQVETFQFSFLDRRQRNRAGIVDANIDAAEAFDGLRHGAFDVIFVANIAAQREGHSTGRFDFLRGRMDRAFEFGIGVNRLGGDRDIGAVARRPLGDG